MLFHFLSSLSYLQLVVKRFFFVFLDVLLVVFILLPPFIVTGCLNWIIAFLHDRVQQVVIRSESSRWGQVTCSGFPQGSVLRPVLFIIYVNDTPSLLSGHVKMFADDTKIYRSIQDREDVEALRVI